MSIKRKTPFGILLWSLALTAECRTQQEFADRMRRHGYTGRQGGFSQTSVSQLLGTNNVRLSPDFFRAAQQAWGLSDEQLIDLFRAWLRS
jgi:hypothetical protein